MSLLDQATGYIRAALQDAQTFEEAAENLQQQNFPKEFQVVVTSPFIQYAFGGHSDNELMPLLASLKDPQFVPQPVQISRTTAGFIELTEYHQGQYQSMEEWLGGPMPSI